MTQQGLHSFQHAWLKTKNACEMTNNRKILKELFDPPPSFLFGSVVKKDKKPGPSL
jgi:hypothetical protein